jgi:acyl-CoA synthetase (AMP-forming)/AMP-acid ligase II
LESCASCGTVLRIAGIGAVCHPINIRLSGQQTEYIINNSRVIFVDATLVPLLEKIAAAGNSRVLCIA